MARDKVVGMRFGDGPCYCGRPAYRRGDGRHYLYIYRLHGPAVCSPRCDKECDCEAPEPKSGVALVSNGCPMHNLYPTQEFRPAGDAEPDTSRCAVCGGLNPGDMTHTRCM